MQFLNKGRDDGFLMITWTSQRVMATVLALLTKLPEAIHPVDGTHHHRVVSRRFLL